MKIQIIPTLEEFCQNKLLLQHYNARQLEAIYEMLLSERRPCMTVRNMLQEKKLIVVRLRYENYKYGLRNPVHVIDLVRE